MNLSKLKRWFVGTPIATAQAHHERLGPVTGLAVFASDNLSSVAYATEEILRVLLLAGVGALAFSVPIGLCIGGVIGIVILSYRQNIAAYPQGASDYIVAKDNLGVFSGLTAGAALLIDYTLTVAVSVSAGVAALTSAFPVLYPYRVVLGVGLVVLVAVANLRGIRESGRVFAVWSYLFIAGYTLLMVYGFTSLAIWGRPAVEAAAVPPPPPPVAELGVFLLLRAFASGAVALTGTEAIATGVPAFKPPESKNAASTLLVMGGVLAILFIGITFLATNFAIYPTVPELFGTTVEHKTVIAQVAGAVFGSSPMFFLFQAFTALLLFLAANTSFAAFPRLAAVLGEDGFFPRQFSFRGDRLAFSTGIILLGLIAASLVIVAGGRTHALIPLYAVGVFIDFTISQAGMIRHWYRERPAGWRKRLVVNAIGCLATAIVAIVVTSVKFVDGAWFVILLIPILVSMMLFIRRAYDAQSVELHVRDDVVIDAPHREQRVVVPVNGINRAVVQAIKFGRTMSEDVRAVFVTEDPEAGEALRTRWDRQIPGVPLVIVESPFRAVISPVIAYLDVLDQAWPPDKPAPITIVVLPEYVARHWWERMLYNQVARRLKAALIGREHTVVADVPFRREH
jgi:amino acid transporter